MEQRGDDLVGLVGRRHARRASDDEADASPAREHDRQRRAQGAGAAGHPLGLALAEAERHRLGEGEDARQRLDAGEIEMAQRAAAARRPGRGPAAADRVAGCAPR